MKSAAWNSRHSRTTTEQSVERQAQNSYDEQSALELKFAVPEQHDSSYKCR